MSKLFAIALVCLLSQAAHAQTPPVLDPETQAKVLRGLQVAPVPLNMVGKDPVMVGLGSYIVNTVQGCNDCHSAGPPTQFLPGANPFQGQHATVNPATYLGGGRDFGAFPADPFPHIVSRNLTPDSSGLPEGGNSLATFIQIMRTGIDTDHLHPTCSGPPNGHCLPAPFNGDLLQIMPWPNFQNMTDLDLQAIYAYLSAIPCLEGGPGEPANRCAGSSGPKTAAVAGPKNLTANSRSLQLDGTQSTSADGKPLTFAWTIPQGSPSAAISGGATATPLVQLTVHGTYTFQLTVTDSSGKTSTDTATVIY